MIEGSALGGGLFCARIKWCASAASKPPPSALPSIIASVTAPVSKACVDCIHSAARGFDTGAVTLAMIEGSALGGGFEGITAHSREQVKGNFREAHPRVVLRQNKVVRQRSFNPGNCL
jgi:hypothetical protein